MISIVLTCWGRGARRCATRRGPPSTAAWISRFNSVWISAQVIAVVPQPIEQQPNGSMAQYRDQIRVYFNDDDLYVPDAENPVLYQLIFTGDTARNTDDVVFHPDSVSYDAGADMAVLTFADDIHLLTNPNTGGPIGAGTFRLRIGTDEQLPLAPHVITPSGDVGSSYDSAWDLGELGGQSRLVSTRIDAQAYLLDFPGGNDEPGHREIPEETAGGYDNHLNPLFGADNTPGVTTVLYNFQANYGVDDQGLPLKNLITQSQKERAREAFEVWGEYIGVQFLETANQGLTIVTGDPHALDPYAPNVVNHTLVKPDVNAHFIVRVDPEYQDSLLILDNANQWSDLFGGDWYQTAMIGIGFMLGLERASDLPDSTLMAFASDFSFPGSTVPEPIFPGNHDILHGSYLHRPDSNDIDLYRFEIAAGQQGLFTAETFAERQPNSSLLDTLMILYRENDDGSRSVVARNDDYYSEDSYIELRLGTGTYFLGVSASGNDQYNPESDDTGFGGMSQGPYDLRVNFQPDPVAGKSLRDATALGAPGTPLDGDADGTPGGAYNFWFRAAAPAKTILVDKMNRAFEAGTKGTYRTISSALAASVPGDIIRIVGNGGSDNNLATLRNNLAYEIGPGPLPNQVLADGKTLDVPKGVTIMVDAGAVFKMNQSRIGVGSASLSVDRSASAFQVLGTPDLPVYFTSYFDESIGLDTYLPTTTPSPGHWGGIVYRNDFDNAEQRFSYEREGVFLNYVNHADIRYGGGNVVIEALKQIVTPIQMTEARPTISFNSITRSADAPISADPNSFEETNFHAPRFQLKGLFTSDYQRVGPDINNNLLLENSSNGLFVRILTPAGDAQKTLTVAGRFDDTDIVHILSENLRIQGISGEPILELVRPPINLVTVAARSGGGMEQLTYRYKIVYVDANGFEGRPSEATAAVTLSGSNRSVRLDKLPTATGDFVARRIYRSTAGIAGPYVFVDQINTSDTVYTDTKSLSALDPNNTLQRDVPTVQGVTLTASTAAGALAAGSYNYRITYFNSAKSIESPSSDPTVTRVLSGIGQIQLSGIVRPYAGSGFDQTRIYRSGNDGDGPYQLAGVITAADTSFLDEGAEPGETLSPALFGVARARTDARLAIDPGTIVKLEGSRIETTFGAQLIAEGLPGREVIFTSRSDDRFGAGGTFDTNGDGSSATPGPGNWGGIYVGALGSASIDNALLTFGGGVTKIEGTFKAFNILEIHQGDVRLANSVIEYNANGQAGQGPADRFGRGYNEPATIYVRGAQPILLHNTIQHNDEVAITINANSFTAEPLPDIGRSTGPISQATSYSANVGPLMRGNRMIDNPLNAVDIRGEVLTTQSVWDDTDIVHVLRDEQIIVPDFHTNVGLRLQSSPSASLVVKMAGPGDNFDPALGAGFTATGRQLDIDDRIGGTMQIIGQPDFPVILTSLSDDTVGAGFQPNGEILTDTNDNGWTTLPKAGDWRSVRLEQFANDRNVELILEIESPTVAAPGDNATPASAQHVGDLAPSEFAGDDNLRLGFDIRGVLNQRNDVDVYSFEASAGGEVWLDIDRTTNTLNSVVELVDASGNVLARSDDSLDESGDPSLLFHSGVMEATAVNPLQKVADEYQPHNASGLPKDFYSLNIYDAGMRVVLPGVVGVRSTYHVRVRSSSDDLDNVNGGLTTGSYQLQVRLRETDEVAGVTVRYADVRYATNGIELFGLPGHSPLLGEVAEDEEVGGPEDNGQVMPGATPGSGPQDIGNLFRTDRAVISIAGTIHSLDDLDFYEMQIAYEATAGSLFQNSPVVFDVDYASGLSRPDTIVSVFDSFGRLVLIGRDSNVADDRGGALDEGDLTDLSRGSLGALDPFIGPVELPEATYFVSVTSNAHIPTQLLSNPDLRLEPVNTITRVAEDHIGSTGGSTAGAPQVPLLLDQSSIIPQLPSNMTVLILHDEGDPDLPDEVLLSAAGLTTGVVTRTVGPYPGMVNDLATREDGNTYTFSTPVEEPAPDDSTVGILRGVNISSPQYIASRDDGIETYQANPLTPSVAIRANVGIRFHAMTYGILDGQERLLAVGSRGDADTRPAGPTRFTNLLYQFDPDTGQATSAPQANRTGNARMQGAGTQIVERGQLDTNISGGPGGLITGLSIYAGKLYALSDTGGLFLVNNPLSNTATLQYIGDVVPNAGNIQEEETNDTLADAQDLDREVWTQRFDANIGDTVSNTSTTIKHITIQGTGDDGYLGVFIPASPADLPNVPIRPTGSVFHPTDDFYYVASADTDEIRRYDAVTGAFVDIFVSAADGGLDQPEGIAFGADINGDDILELYVASRATDQILRYDGASGDFIDVFAQSPIPWQPTGLAFGPDANGDDTPELYVSGFLWDNVLELNGATGGMLRQLVPSGRGGLTGPVGLSFEAGGMLYVASSSDDSVLRYNAITGAFIDDLVVTASGGLDQPQYFVVGPDANADGDDELYVTSFGNDSVLRYNARTGAFIDDFVYSGNGGMDGPTSVAFHPDGSLVVASSVTNSVLKFDTAGTPTFDFFKFTIENDDDLGIFDLDFGFLAGDPGSFNGEIFIVDATGALVDTNNDASVRYGRGGSDNARDPYLEVVFATAGEYYVAIGEFDSDAPGGGILTGNRPDLTDTYTLQISIQNYKGSSLEGMAVSMLPDATADGVFIAINNQGDLLAFTTDDTAVIEEPFFEGGASRISTGVQDVLGIALTNTNMWHISDARRDDKGHGLTNVFDDSRGNASVVKERESNDTPATAHDLELEFWSLGYDSNIGDTQDPPVNTSTTIPHVTIKGSGDGTYDFYSFEVTTVPARAIFDIDMDFDEQLDPHGFMDAEVILTDEYGNVITWLEDAALPTDGDGGKEFLFDPPLEPCLEYVFNTPGTYMVAVTKFVDPFIWQPLEEGDFYTLQVSVENHRIDGPATDAGLSFFFGPELTGLVTGAVAGDPVNITSPGHGLLGGERVDVQGVLGIPGANGTFTVSVVDDDNFELTGSDATGTYLGGGTWRLLQIPEDVQGSIITRPFSLLGYSADDQPVLYFNYLLDGDAAADIDLATVSIIEGNGTPQPLVVKGAGLVNSTPGATPTWRQARVELGDYANKEDLRLVFSFDSADSVSSGFEGLLIDDIIIGFAERGEMVSYAYNDPTFTINPDSATTDALTGPYQLEIRPASDPGPSQRPVADQPNSQQLTMTWDTNERFAQQTSLVPPAGSDITDGDTFTISDGIKTLTFEYDDDDSVAEGNVRVSFQASDTAQQVGGSIRDAINSLDVQLTIGVTATVSAATIRGTNFADGTIPSEPLYQLVDLAGTAIVTGIQHLMYNGNGDVNRFRDQGQVIIHSNFITHSRDFGIVADAGTRDVEPRLQTAFLAPHAGAARNLRELNNQPDGGLAPGAVIENNVITNEGLGGIHISGNMAPFEIVPPTDTLAFPSGRYVCDGQSFTIHTYRSDVRFEFEDISGGSAPCGSTVQGGNGWTAGSIPIFYRQSGGNYLAPPWVIPPRPYNQSEMATAIRDAIQSSILVTNGTTLHANVSLELSRTERSAIVPDNALYGPPLVAVYLDNVSSIDLPTNLAVTTRRDPNDVQIEIPVSLGLSAQPFHRVLNNTVYGNDGTQAFYPGTGLSEPNDQISTAVETWQGRQHNPAVFSSDGIIGDGTETLNDPSLDVDFYRFQLAIGERVTVDMSSEKSVLVNDPTTDPFNSGNTQSETTMVVLGNRIVVGYNDSGSQSAGDKFTGYAISVDGGRTFTDMGELPDSPNDDSGDPVLARDEVSGTIYFASLTNATGPIQVFRSYDDGETFTAPVVATPGKTGFQDKPWIAVDNFAGPGQGNVYVTATDFSGSVNNGIYFFRSTNDGNSYGPTGGTLIAATSGVQGSWVTVDPNHTVYVFYFDGSVTPQTIKMRKSFDNGATFSSAVTVATLATTAGNGDLGLTRSSASAATFRTNAFPQVVVNPVSGHLYMTYNNDPTGTDKADVYFTSSTNGGLTWSTPTRVNDDGTRNDQWQPTIAVTPDGKSVGVFWYDRRLSPTNSKIDYFGRIGTATASGVAFLSPSFRVNDQSFDPVFADDPLLNPTYMGDYDQAQADNEAFYVIWADNGLGTPDVRFARVPLVGQQDAVDPVLRLFNNRGEELALATGINGSLDFTAPSAGTYYVGVSGRGNETYDPLSLGNRTGPASVGSYRIEIDVIAPRTWVITAQDGTQVQDGTTFTVSDINNTVTYEFDDVNAPGVTAGNIPIVYDSRPVRPTGFNHRGPGYRAPEMAVAMANTIGQGLTGVTAVALGGFSGASGALPPQVPSIPGDTSVYGFPGFGHDNPFTPPETSGELYVVISGASRIEGSVLFRPALRENIDQLMPETGILISERSSPTLLNNVLSNLNAGIWQDASPTTVVGSSVYQHNDQADSNVGETGDDFNVHLGDFAALFVNAGDGNFYPAPLSPIIDSAIDSLEDRVQYATVKGAVGIPVSPILAPDLDAAGLLRSDDPEVETPSGQGANVFKDRGGLDRADFAGPDAILIVPRDNDAAGLDLDPTDTIVQLAEGRYDNFTIQLVDGLQSSTSGEGVGVDDLSIDASKITLTADGQLLTEDVDYSFRYNPTTNTIRLTPLAGAWDNNKAYVISLPNEDRFVIDMPNGAQVSDGETFVITDNTNATVTFEFESGYTLLVPETLKLFVPAVGKGPGGIQDGQRFTVSTGVNQYTFEYDANTPPSFLPGNTPINIAAISTQDQIALATVNALIARNIGVTPVYLGNGVIHFGALSTYSVNTALSTLTQSGQPGVVADGNTISIADGVLPTRIFEFDSNGSVPLGRTPIPFSAASTQDDLAVSIATVVGGSGLGLAPTYFGEGRLHIGGTPSHRVVVSGSPKLSLQGIPGVQSSTTLVVPPQAAGVGGIADGQWFSIQNRPNDPVVFEFDNNGIVSPGAHPILFTPTSTVDQLSGFIVSAINLAGVGLAPTYLGTGQIALHDTIHHKTNTLNTKVDQFGIPGGVVQVDFLPDETFAAEDFAPIILDAIDDSLLTGVTTTFRGGSSYFINGIKSISGLQNFFISSIKDNAGNSLQPNQASNQTYFTILMPGVQFDFGDAPASYDTLFADNGARHVISENPLLLGSGATTESDGLPSPGADADDDDDGVDLSQSVFNQYLETPITVTASGRGFLDAWIDFNGDGDWNDPLEQIVDNQPVVAGINELIVRTIATATTGETFARFRISRLGELAPNGVATDGEVEDYLIRIEPGIPPVATNDSGLSTDESTPLTIDPVVLLANDFDLDTPHDQLSVLRFSATSTLGATLSWDVGGNVVYDPTTSDQIQALNPGEQVTDTFQYQAIDGVLPSNWATVAVIVHGLNNAPVAVPDDYATGEDTILNVAASGVLGNDDDPDLNDSIAVSGHDLLSSMGAAITMSANGGFTYNPTQAAAAQGLAAGEPATDTFTYTITDTGGLSSSTVVTIRLTGVNDSPSAADDAYTSDEDTVFVLAAPGVLDNDVDIDGDPISVFGADAQSTLGALITLNADGSLSYDPTSVAVLQNLPMGATMNDTFTYTVTDSHGLLDTAVVTMTIQGRNDAPDAANDGYATDEDLVLVVIPAGVLANDRDRDGDTISVDVANTDTVSAMGATVAVAADGGFTYDPTNATQIRNLVPGNTAFDTFTYTLVDAHGGTDTATVTIRVTGVNSAPVATDKGFPTNEDAILNVPAPGLLSGDYDPDGQNIEIFDYDTTSALGATVVVNANGSFTYNPTASATLQALNVGGSLTDTFTYTIVDDDVNSKSATGTISIEVAGLNDAPVAVNDTMLVPRNTTSTLNVLANDRDVDGTLNASTVTVQTNPAHGTATVLADGRIRYVPTNNYSGNDTLTYTVRDNSGAVSNVATVSLRVNAAPIANNDVVQTFKNVPITISVLANDQDVDGTLDPTSVTIVNQPTRGAASITANGRVIYTPNSNFTGNDSFTYTVKDNHGVVSNIATVSIAVIVDPFPWQNPINALDVNNDGSVSPIDVLLVVSDLNKNGSRDLPNPPVPPKVPPPFLDVTGDNRVSPVDALTIITYLNGGSGEGEGEGEAGPAMVELADSRTVGLFAQNADFQTGDTAASGLSENRSSGQTGTGNAHDSLLLVGSAEDVRRAAVDSFLSSSALDEALEELINSGQGLHDEDLLEDQALLELLFGKESGK